MLLRAELSHSCGSNAGTVFRKQGLGTLSVPRNAFAPENDVCPWSSGTVGEAAGTRDGDVVLSSEGLRDRGLTSSRSSLGHWTLL